MTTDVIRFTDEQLARLKKEYEVLRNKTISTTNASKLYKMFDNYSSQALKQLADADIPFISEEAALNYEMKIFWVDDNRIKNTGSKSTDVQQDKVNK